MGGHEGTPVRRMTFDDIDFSAYERQTDCKAKIKPAGVFEFDTLKELCDKDHTKSPHMLSTKLRNKLHFREGEVTCWAGYNGHRKSLMLGQVCLDLAHQGQRGLIISPEMQPERTLARMVRQALATDSPARQSVSHFMKWTDSRLWLFDHMGRLTPDKVLAAARYFREELSGQYIVIDSMMMVCRSEEDMDEQKQFITDLVRSAQETSLHIHLVAHCRKPQVGDDSKMPTRYDIRGSSSITDQLQNVVLVWANKRKAEMARAGALDPAEADKPDAVVIVDKQRNGSFEGKSSLYFDSASMRFTDSRLAPVEPYRL